jgi:hypothetical protein
MLSVLYAYDFLGLPEQPDPYCRLFYEEMCDGLVRRLLALCDEGLDAEALQATSATFELAQQVLFPTHAAPEPDFGELLARPGPASMLRETLLPSMPRELAPDQQQNALSATNVVAELIEDLEFLDESVSDTETGSNEGPARCPTARPSRLRWDLHAK